jgi:hypothetical protein
VPPKSKAQARLFRAVAAGKARKKTGLSRSKAREMVKGHRTRNLPARKRKRRRKK